MTDSTLEAMAREAGFIMADDDLGASDLDVVTITSLRSFAALVRAQALEDAAKKVDSYAELVDAFNGLNFRHCAAAIRALSASEG